MRPDHLLQLSNKSIITSSEGILSHYLLDRNEDNTYQLRKSEEKYDSGHGNLLSNLTRLTDKRLIISTKLSWLDFVKLSKSSVTHERKFKKIRSLQVNITHTFRLNRDEIIVLE